jgi:dTDP-glucose 4,6-dehydratase
MKNEFGWEPQNNFDEALKLTIEWYKNNETWWKSVKTGQYMEYYKKQYSDNS